ncbi:MAG: IS21 family transposase [Clostridiales bacterium]|jgi:transposase|nr:IS21 family transposase [Clostridiales bacterium]
MVQIEYIKYLYECEGKSLREIAKEVGMNFRTVQKYAYMNNFEPQIMPNMEPESYPILGAYIAVIDEWMEQDAREPRKQRHTAQRIYDRLREEHGYKGSYSSVKRYVVKKRWLLSQAREGYLPIAQPPGHAQTDFGMFKYYDGLGVAKEGYALVVTFPYSNAGWMQVFPAQNQECLLEGLKRIFYHIGGVPIRLRCDNMTTAVAQVLEGAERILSDGFYRFKLHHRFETDFCNPASGNEKGNVENKVGYDRRNMLVPVPVIEDFAAYNEELFARCDADHEREHYRHKESISQLWAQEKGKLLTLPKYEYGVFRYESLNVNKTGFVLIDTNRYGLSPVFAGKMVQAKIFFDRVELYYDRQLLKTYERSYGRAQEVTDWKQYLPVLLRKPGAAEHTRFFEQMPKLWQQYLKNTSGKERKSALMLLTEIINDGNESLCDDALEMAGEYGRLDNDSIRQCYLFISKQEHYPQPLKLTADTPSLNYRPDLSVYDRLTGGTAL